jgi:photosynthetic reaction center cytochrome c subunit
VNCTTCHQGVAKPLGGLAMAKDYPSLQSPGGGSQAAVETAEASEALAAVGLNETVEDDEPAEL